MEKERRKRDRICVVCGKEFKGTAASVTCSGSCRIELARLKKANKRPEFILVAKGKGQKIPDLNAPKRLKFKKGEKKSIVDWVYKNIVISETTKESFDGEKINPYLQDEAGQMEIPKELTKEQKMIKIAELNKRLEIEKRKQCPMGTHPKTFRLTQDSIISEIQEQLKQLTPQ